MLLELMKQLVCLTGYISQNAFPQPLEEHDEAVWVRRLQEGDMEAKEVLIQHNLRLVAHIAKKFDNVAEDQDDLISIGTIGLIKAINTFNPEKKAKLGTYAARCVENEILMYIRAQRKHKCEISLNEPIGTDTEGNQISLRDVLGTEGDMVAEEVEQNCEYLNLLGHMHCLTQREQKVIALRYGLTGEEAFTQKEVGAQLGVSRSYVSRIEKKALEKLMHAIKLRE